MRQIEMNSPKSYCNKLHGILRLKRIAISSNTVSTCLSKEVWSEVPQRGTKVIVKTSDEETETELCQMSSPLDSHRTEESVVF